MSEVSETIEAEIHGQVFRRRTTTGKRFIAYAQDEDGELTVATFKSAEKAEAWGFWMRDSYDCLAHGWARATVVPNRTKLSRDWLEGQS